MTRWFIRCVLGGIAFVFAFWLMTQVAEARGTPPVPEPGIHLPTIDPTSQGRRHLDGHPPDHDGATTGTSTAPRPGHDRPRSQRDGSDDHPPVTSAPPK